jgi:hypothetical protein
MAISEGPMTINSLVDEILDVAHGYVRAQEQRTYLTNSMTNVATTFTVPNNAQDISKGLVEIEDELVYVTAVDKNTGTVTIAPWGRGQAQTEAVAHSANVIVTNSPLFPRQRVRSVLWGVLREVFPDIAAFGEQVTTVSPVVTNYVMPSDCFHVQQVLWKVPGPSGMWKPAKTWRQNKRAGDPVEIELLSFAFPGSNRLRVEYMKNPVASFGATDDLSTYGYDFQIRDVLVLGSASRLLSYVESGRVLVESVVASNRTETTPPGAAMSASKTLYQMFQARLMSERQQQFLRHPAQLHFTR